MRLRTIIIWPAASARRPDDGEVSLRAGDGRVDQVGADGVDFDDGANQVSGHGEVVHGHVTEQAAGDGGVAGGRGAGRVATCSAAILNVLS